MNVSRKTVTFVLICTAVGFLLGLLSSYLAAHGEHAISLGQRIVISVGVAAVWTQIGGFLRGNRAVAFAALVDERSAQQFTPVRGRAVVYLFRDSFAGKFLGIDVERDHVLMGQTRGKTFFRFEFVPGDHVLSSRNPQDGSITRLTFSAASDSILFFEHQIKLGARALKHDFVATEAVAATARIRRCRLLAEKSMPD